MTKIRPKFQPEKFKDMPKPESILTISWEDVYGIFIDNDLTTLYSTRSTI